MKEIGSEFWLEGTMGKRIIQDNCAYLLSGRTALDFIIKDIKTQRQFLSVMLPSYCCESMIEPFERNDVEVQFYRVREDGIDYSFSKNCDAVLLLDFFGYETPENKKIAQVEKDAGKIIIYDSTHKLNGASIQADYTFCSYRKWFYCNFATLQKTDGSFNIPIPTRLNKYYCETRDVAAKLKADFIAGADIDKKEYLRLFSISEDILDCDYVDYAGVPMDVDVETIITARRRNAQYLIHKLLNVPGIKLWRSAINSDDTPMFVPILVKYGRRDALKRYLINHSIYCPVHWPLSSRHGEYKDLYDEELSLICDQRYSIEDMDREIAAIKGFFNEVRG
jgi:hypothetical protein